jgi:TetR/AcrR family transcriptional regulator
LQLSLCNATLKGMTSVDGRRLAAGRPPRLPKLSSPPTGADVSREKLLEATHELLFERSGADPSVSQIAERAGLPGSMVNYCFGGKTRLFEALVERTLAGVLAELDRLTKMDLTPEAKLRLHIAAIINNYVRYPYANALSERLAVGALDTVHRGEFVARPAMAFYRDVIAAGVADGAFREIDPTLLFFSVIGMCEYLFAARSLVEGAAGETIDDALIERFTDHTIELLLHGITR